MSNSNITLTSEQSSNLEQDFLYNLGSFIATAKYADAYKKANPELHSKLSKFVSKQIAKVAAEGLERRLDMSKFQPSVYVLKKVAATKDENWTSYHNDVVDGIIKSAASVVGSASTAMSLGMKGVTPIIGTIPALAAASVPLTGMTLGSGIHAAERSINEDDLQTEKLKALIIKYKQMTAKLEREIASKLEQQSV